MSPGLVHALAARAAPLEPLVELLGRVHVRPTVRPASAGACVSSGEARLLAFLALRPGESDRRTVAGTLWPDVDEARAAGNLRSALWRLNALPTQLAIVTRWSVALRPEVHVDIRLLGDWAARMISGSHEPDDLAHIPWDISGVDLLPGWHDDWITLERERVRQRLLHAFERLSVELVAAGRCAEAIEVALIAVRADGLRESAQRALISAHLAEGNWAEARRCFSEHRDLLARELGVAPTPALAALVAAVREQVAPPHPTSPVPRRRPVAALPGS